MNTPSRITDDNWPDTNLAFCEAINFRLEGYQNDDHVSHETNSNQLHHQLWQEGKPDYLGIHAFQNILQKLQETVPVPQTSVSIDMPAATSHERDGTKK